MTRLDKKMESNMDVNNRIYRPEDRIMSTISFSSDKIEVKTLIISVDKVTSSFLGAINEEEEPSFYFQIDDNDIVNFVEYSNGDEPKLNNIRTFKKSVKIINDVCLVDFSTNVFNQQKAADVILNSIKAENIIILHSIRYSLFTNISKKPSDYYILSTDTKESNLPIPNFISGVGSGIFTLSLVNNIPCKMYLLIEEDFGSTIQCFQTIANIIKQFVAIDVEKVIQTAVRICHDAFIDYKNFYI